MTNPESGAEAAAGGEAGTDIITAAHHLGLQVETLRKRLQRGSIKGFKAEDGTWRVILDPETRERMKSAQDVEQATITVLLAEVAALRQQASELADETRQTAELLTETRESIGALHRLIESLQRPDARLGTDDQLRPVMMAVLEYLQKSRPAG